MGSWLCARLAYLLGGQDQFAGCLSRTIVHGEKVLCICIDVLDATHGVPVGRLNIRFNQNLVCLEGTHDGNTGDAIIDDFQRLLLASAMTIAKCSLKVGHLAVGWDGQAFHGQQMRTSVIADEVAVEKLGEYALTHDIQLGTGDDSVSTDETTLKQIGKYLAIESSDCRFIPTNLRYLRSALIDTARYWIWEYLESDGTKCYVTIREAGRAASLDVDDAGSMTPEQYIHTHHNVCQRGSL